MVCSETDSSLTLMFTHCETLAKSLNLDPRVPVPLRSWNVVNLWLPPGSSHHLQEICFQSLLRDCSRGRSCQVPPWEWAWPSKWIWKFSILQKDIGCRGYKFFLWWRHCFTFFFQNSIAWTQPHYPRGNNEKGLEARTKTWELRLKHPKNPSSLVFMQSGGI